MQRLILFLLNYRAFIFFAILEVLCTWLIVRNNQYQSAAFFNSANHLTAQTMMLSNDVRSYFFLAEVNQQLAEENAQLREQLSSSETRRYSGPLESTGPSLDIQYKPAIIINKTTNRFHNYLTINQGMNDGILPGMGVIGPQGVVGKVKASSGRFSTVISILNTEVLVSSLIVGSNTFCTTKWDGKDSQFSYLHYVPRHVSLSIGDTVVTSGYNAVFPEGISIGVVDDVQIAEEATFYQIRIKLSTDFSSLAAVYVVKNPARQEIDSLQSTTIRD